MRGRVFVTVVSAALILTGCAHGATLKSSPCAAAKGAAHREYQALQNTNGALATMPNPYPSDNPDWSWDPNDPEQQKYDRVSNLARSETRVLARIIVNSRACFPPATVARAQEFLDNAD